MHGRGGIVPCRSFGRISTFRQCSTARSMPGMLSSTTGSATGYTPWCTVPRVRSTSRSVVMVRSRTTAITSMSIACTSIWCVRGGQVLEIGCGNGFNLRRVGRRKSHVQFTGVDLAPDHVSAAIGRSRGAENLDFRVGDFADMHFLANEQFDLVFAVEAICQGTRMANTLREAHRVLKPGGLFIVFDCFRGSDLDALAEDLRVAARLVEKTTAVDSFWPVARWLTLGREIGFLVEDEVTDLTAAVWPDLLRLRAIARSFFEAPLLKRELSRFYSPLVLENAVERTPDADHRCSWCARLLSRSSRAATVAGVGESLPRLPKATATATPSSSEWPSWQDGPSGRTDGMLYPVLRRARAPRSRRQRSGRASDNGRRAAHRLTKEGRSQLAAQRKQWRAVDGTLREIWMQARTV